MKVCVPLKPATDKGVNNPPNQTTFRFGDHATLNYIYSIISQVSEVNTCRF